MNSNDLKGMPTDELKEQLDKSTQELYKARVSATMKELTNTAKLRDLRRDVARIKQVLADRAKADAK